MKRTLFSIDYARLRTFEDFIYDSTNEESIQLLEKTIQYYTNSHNIDFIPSDLKQTVVENPERFLLLRGDTSTGKSHLLEAIAHRLHSINPELNIALGQAKELIPLYSDKKNNNKKLQTLEEVDVLLLDDLHLLAGSAHLLQKQDLSISISDANIESQHELAQYLDRLINKEAFVVFTYSLDNDFTDFTKKKNAMRLENALYSRLFHGITLNLHPAGLNIFSLYAQKVSAKNNLSLSKPMYLTLARFARDLRQLEGLIKTIASYVRVNNKGFGEEELAVFLTEFEGKKEITPTIIISHTAQHFQLQIKDIKSKSRSSNHVLARQISMFLCRQLLGYSFPKIAKEYGGKDHTTIMYACSKIEKDNYLLNVAKDISQSILHESSTRLMRI